MINSIDNNNDDYNNNDIDNIDNNNDDYDNNDYFISLIDKTKKRPSINNFKVENSVLIRTRKISLIPSFKTRDSLFINSHNRF
jgi:hypothetical protein